LDAIAAEKKEEKKLSKIARSWLRFRDWVGRRKRPILIASCLLLSFLGGGLYSFLANRSSLRKITPLGGDAAVTLSSPAILDQSHPISGVFYSVEQKGVWEGRRPLAVMIDNHRLARPFQHGLQKADLIWEAVAEGGITRLLAIFHGNDVDKLGAVRSSRVYYIDWALEFPAYYSHVGGAGTIGSPANIFVYISQKGVLDLDQFRLGSTTYWSGGNVVMSSGVILSRVKYTSTAKLWEAGEILYQGTNELPDFRVWKFKNDAPFYERAEEQEIAFNFWYLAAYEVRWRYNQAQNVYLRWQGGEEHIDQATQDQLWAKNVVLFYTRQRSAGDGTSHLLHDTVGSGDAVVFRDGQEILATWQRGSLSDRTFFYKRGTQEEIEFNRGLTWIEVLPK
jgi:hypothetical protein